MRSCPKCNQEYLDTVTVCADDQTPLVPKLVDDAPALRNDVTRLTTLVTLEDRFEADELAQDLADEGYDVALVASKAPTLGPLTTPGPTVFSVVVPDTEAAAAAVLVAEWREAIEKNQEGAEKAAEEEEALGERQS